jgi:hypothetical protein
VENVREKMWFTEPFEWYQLNLGMGISLTLSDRYNIDFLGVLYEIYKSFVDNDSEQGIADVKELATLMIAMRLGLQNEVIEELMVENLSDQIDSLVIDSSNKEA